MTKTQLDQVRAALKVVDYRYFGHYEFSDAQWEAFGILETFAKERLAALDAEVGAVAVAFMVNHSAHLNDPQTEFYLKLDNAESVARHFKGIYIDDSLTLTYFVPTKITISGGTSVAGLSIIPPPTSISLSKSLPRPAEIWAARNSATSEFAASDAVNLVPLLLSTTIAGAKVPVEVETPCAFQWAWFKRFTISIDKGIVSALVVTALQTLTLVPWYFNKCSTNVDSCATVNPRGVIAETTRSCSMRCFSRAASIAAKSFSACAAAVRASVRALSKSSLLELNFSITSALSDFSFSAKSLKSFNWASAICSLASTKSCRLSTVTPRRPAWSMAALAFVFASAISLSSNVWSFSEYQNAPPSKQNSPATPNKTSNSASSACLFHQLPFFFSRYSPISPITTASVAAKNAAVSQISAPSAKDFVGEDSHENMWIGYIIVGGNMITAVGLVTMGIVRYRRRKTN